MLAATLSTIYDVVKTKQDSTKLFLIEKKNTKIENDGDFNLISIFINVFSEEKQQIFMAFSLVTNGRRLFSCKKPRAYGMLECLNGMRVLSAFWVIYAHSNIVSLGGPLFNIKFLLEVCIVNFFSLSISICLLMFFF